MTFFPFLNRLSTRLSAVVVTIILGFLVVIGVGVNSLLTGWIGDSSLASLSAVATARQQAIEAQVSRYFDVASAFVAPDLEYDVQQLLASEGALAEARREALFQSLLRKLGAVDLLAGAQVVDLENRIIVQTDPGEEAYLDIDAPAFHEGTHRAQLSIPISGADGTYMEMVHPLSDARGNTIAVLVIREMADNLLAITGDYTGLGETGETVLSVRQGDSIRFIVPLRFSPDLSRIPPIPISGEGETAGPAIRATAGQSGLVRSVDYRGERVVAAYRPIARVGWGLVAKQDEEEVYGSVEELRSSMLLLFVALMGLAAAIVIPIVSAFTKPLRTLEKATGEVISGNLDVRVPEPNDPETGALARAFNVMVGRVKKSQEDLERRNTELGAFAHVVSHDLKAPLRGVASLATWLQEDLGPSWTERIKRT